VRRQKQLDLALVFKGLRDLSDRQTELFAAIMSALARYEAPILEQPIDDDFAGGLSSLAATLETAGKGVIYEHRAESRTADRVAASLKSVLAELGRHQGSTFDRDAAVVLRRIEAIVRDTRAVEPNRPRAFIELLRRTVGNAAAEADRVAEGESPRLIVP
jgi:hypothetical protein